MIISIIILTAYVAAMASAVYMRTRGLQRYRLSALGRARVKREFWAFGRWATALAILPIAVNKLLGLWA